MEDKNERGQKTSGGKKETKRRWDESGGGESPPLVREGWLDGGRGEVRERKQDICVTEGGNVTCGGQGRSVRLLKRNSTPDIKQTHIPASVYFLYQHGGFLKARVPQRHLFWLFSN